MNLCNPEGFRNEIKEVRNRGSRSFFTWFDGGETVDGAFDKANDIFCCLMLPWATKFIGDLSDKVSLDIGYGGGGQVVAASKHFKYAIGMDVHNEISFVEAELRKRQGGQNKNTALFIGQGNNIPTDNNSIDFIHSWVTFLFLGTIQNVETYLKEIKRVLKPGGVAVIFFTRLVRSHRVQSLEQYKADLDKEKENELGYREGGPLTIVNRPNLIMSLWKMTLLVEAQNFVSLVGMRSQEGDKIYGQHGLVFQKPKNKPKLKVKKINKKKGK